MKRVLLPVIIIILLISSCSSNSTIILWTDKPEMAAYVEEFNSVQDRYRIEIVYKKEPGNTLIQTENSGDLIISEFLNSPETIGQFSSLADMYDENKLDLSIFYSGLLDLGYYDSELVLLPISFNLPIVMFKKATESEDIPSFYMNPEDLKNAAINFNTKSDANFEVMGFSTRWDKELLFVNSVLMETNFRMLSTGVLSWDKQNLLESINYSKEWSKEINGGLELEEEFTTKFLYDPSYKLIEDNRILFFYSDLVDFFGIPPEKRKNLDFRWLSSHNLIPVLGNILFTGIPEKAKNKKGATQFLHWFFDPLTQKRLIKSSQIKRMDTFGFAHGFSSLPEINKNELAIIYPNLVGKIPQASSLIFPGALPLYWIDLKNKVINPWLYEQTGPAIQETSLQSAIEDWLKQRP